MRYRFLEAHRQHRPVRLMCRVLRVAPGGYYGWRGRPASPRARRREASVGAIVAIHGEVKARYGSPRILAGLAARGRPCCVNTLAGLMRERGIAAETKRKYRSATDSNHGRPVAEDVLARRFEPGAANVARATEITYVPTREGWLYLAAVEGLHSRRVVGWSMSQRVDSRLVVDALETAVHRRLPGEGLVAHSDRGSRYASEHYRRALADPGIARSMNRRDNSPMESFLATLKRELVRDEYHRSRREAKASLFEYIEAFYNRVRGHSVLVFTSPIEYERAG